MNKKVKEIVYFQGKKYTFGTRRKRTEMDDIYDEIILENYYEANPDEEKTPDKDKEILRKSYIMPIRDED